MENKETPNFIQQDDLLKSYLLETCKWAKVLAIFGYVGFVLMLIFSAVSFFLPAWLFREIQQPEIPMGFIAPFYLIYAAIYFFPVHFLYLFSKKVKSGLLNDEKEVLTDGFKNLKYLFKFTAILSIIVLLLFALTTIIAIPLLIFAVI